MRGASDTKKRKSLLDHFRKNADILIMQESHSTTENENLWRNEWGGEVIFSHGTNMARGIAIFCTKTVYNCISNIYCDNEGRLIIFDVTESDKIITITAIYAPNEDKPMYFKNIRKMLQNRQEK